MANFRRPEELLCCSFCGKSQNDVRKLIAGPGFEDVQRELLGAVLRSMRAAGVRHANAYATPAASAHWRDVLMGLEFVPVDVELLYSIEQP